MAKSKRERRPRQPRLLAEMEPLRIPELDDLADEYHLTLQNRMEMTREEVRLRHMDGPSWPLTFRSRRHCSSASCPSGHDARPNHTLHLTDSAEGHFTRLLSCVPPHPQVSFVR